MTTRKKANPPEYDPVVDGRLDWMDSPDGGLSIEVMDTVFALLENVDVDAKARQLIWPHGQMARGSLLTSPCSAFTPTIRNPPQNALRTA